MERCRPLSRTCAVLTRLLSSYMPEILLRVFGPDCFGWRRLAEGCCQPMPSGRPHLSGAARKPLRGHAQASNSQSLGVGSGRRQPRRLHLSGGLALAVQHDPVVDIGSALALVLGRFGEAHDDFGTGFAGVHRLRPGRQTGAVGLAAKHVVVEKRREAGIIQRAVALLELRRVRELVRDFEKGSRRSAVRSSR